MTQTSDLNINLGPFYTNEIDSETVTLNETLLGKQKTNPCWGDVGAAEYRRMRTEGEHPFLQPVKVAHATDILIASRTTGRDIECRLIRPQAGIVKGIFLHIHGGGWVLGSADECVELMSLSSIRRPSPFFDAGLTTEIVRQDTLLDHISRETGLIVISVGFRLAPEHPHPAAEEDVQDVAEHLIDLAPSEYQTPLRFIGGESAGSQLSIQTIIHLLQSRSAFSFQGAVLTYGGYDMNCLPSGRSFVLPMPLNSTSIDRFVDAYLPARSVEDRRDPAVSPIYHPIFQYYGTCRPLEFKVGIRRNLPPALFLVGTQDAVLDDTILMCAKWQISGGEAVVKFIAGAPHGFMDFDPARVKVATQGYAAMMEFLIERLR